MARLQVDAFGAGGLRRQFENRERVPRVSAGPLGDERRDLRAQLDPELRRAAQRDPLETFGRVRLQLVQLARG